jgi:hypothetical protein
VVKRPTRRVVLEGPVDVGVDGSTVVHVGYAVPCVGSQRPRFTRSGHAVFIP